jgi:hypothetical protein
MKGRTTEMRTPRGICGGRKGVTEENCIKLHNEQLLNFNAARLQLNVIRKITSRKIMREACSGQGRDKKCMQKYKSED